MEDADQPDPMAWARPRAGARDRGGLDRSRSLRGHQGGATGAVAGGSRAVAGVGRHRSLFGGGGPDLAGLAADHGLGERGRTGMRITVVRVPRLVGKVLQFVVGFWARGKR